MSHPKGDFLWYELLTTDPDAAASFYGALTGWKAQEAGPVPEYRILGPGEAGIAGLMALPEDAARAGMRPGWIGYIAVPDVDAAVAAIIADGGRPLTPAMEIPGVGRFALLADPQGAVFYVMHRDGEGCDASFHPAEPGHCRWNELATTDPASALRFYHRHFGWERSGAMPMGEMGEYQFLSHAGQAIGAVMPVPPGRPPGFTFYFGVRDIDEAAGLISAKGGAIHFGPCEIPGGEYAVVASDPQGATFGLVGPRPAG